MSWLTRLVGWGGPDEEGIGREVEEELRFHIEMRARDNEAAGMEPEEARREARRRFGDFDRIASASRAERQAAAGSGARGSGSGSPAGIGSRSGGSGGGSRSGGSGSRSGGSRNGGSESGIGSRLARSVEELRQDLHGSLRAFARSPGFVATAVVTLALGLGATTAIYSLANWVLLRPVPGVEDPGELSTVWTGHWQGEGFRVTFISYPNLRDVAGRLTNVSGLAGYADSSVSVALPRGEARRVSGHQVTASYFDVLGVEAALGRTFTGGQDDPATVTPVAVVSHRLWNSMFHGDRGVLGRELRVNGQPFTVIGVLEEGFHGTERLGDVDVWVPGSTYGLVRHFSDPEYTAARESGVFHKLIARRAPGATWDQVEAELASLGDWLVEQHPETNASFEEAGFHVFRSFGMEPMSREPVAATLALLMAVAGVALLIACANVANLLLIRGLGRRGEVAVRKALGAGRGRLLRQYLTEGVVLWLLGGLGGVGLAFGLTSVFAGTQFGFAEVGDVAVDGRVFLFAMTVSLAVGVLFAAIPAVTTRRVDATGVLKEASSAATSGRSRARTALSVVQLAASLTLLVGALLLVRSLQNLSAVELGFDPTGIHTATLNPMDMGYSQSETLEYYRAFERRLRARPEVAAAVVAERVPLGWRNQTARLKIPGEEASDALLEVQYNTVYTTGFFEVFGIPVLRGRVFGEEDLAAPGGEARSVVVFTESLARRLFGSVDAAVGRSVEYALGSREGRRYRVIGVVRDVRYGNLAGEPAPFVYEPVGLPGRFIFPAAPLMVRTVGPGTPSRRSVAGETVAIEPVVQEVAGSIDPDLPVEGIRPLDDLVAAAMSQSRLIARLMTLLAGLATVLAAVGLYGVVAFGVRARTRELGIRIALGAEPDRIFRLVMRGTAGMTLAGLVLGLGGAAALVRFLESRLFGVTPFEPGIWALSAAGLVLIAFVAAWVPSRRAARLDPVETLRDF